MATFVVDKGLNKLLAQINAAAPGRSKASDGSIGDAAHASRDSDHNPESPPPPGNPDNQVDARDFTHDPAHNADMGTVTESIRVSRDRRVSYVIFNGRIFSSYDSTGGRKAWQWGKYTGTDPHTGHAHVSVNDGNHDQTQPWQIGIDEMAFLPRNEYVQHVINYRVDAIIHMRPTCNIPAYTASDGTRFPAISENNDLAAAIRALAVAGGLSQEEIDKLASEIAAEVTAGLNVPSADENAAATVEAFGKDLAD